jgi:rRNA maturation RNase YbeY
MITVNFFSNPKFAYPRQKFLKLVKSICKRFRVNIAVINIVITNNRQIRSFNKKFHHRNAVTDCLSFDLSETPFTAEHTKTAKKYSKAKSSLKNKYKKISASSAVSAVSRTFDIIVNAQKANSESKKRGQSPYAELALYITHALLHNLGFDDSTAKKATLMHQTEDEILQQEGFGKVFKNHLKQQSQKKC